MKTKLSYDYEHYASTAELPEADRTLVAEAERATRRSHAPYSKFRVYLLLVLAGTVKYIPFASRSALSSMMQLSGEIEEAAIIQDIPWFKRMTRIIIPIQKSSIISGYLLPFMTYRLAKLSRETGLRAGFMHVPTQTAYACRHRERMLAAAADEEAKEKLLTAPIAGMELEMMVKGTRAALEACLGE